MLDGVLVEIHLASGKSLRTAIEDPNLNDDQLYTHLLELLTGKPAFKQIGDHVVFSGAISAVEVC